MIVWFSLVGVLVATRVVLGRLDSKRMRQSFLLITGTATALVMGLRHPLHSGSYDVRNYYRFYERLIGTSWSDVFDVVPQFEAGYVVANKLLASIIPWPQFVLIAEAVFCVYAVTRFIYLNTDHVFDGMLYYVTLGTMTFQLTGFRQAVAMGVCMLSVELAKSRRALPFLLLVLVAATFHRTAIVFLPAYFLIGRKPTFTSMTLAVGALVAGTLSAEYITVRGNTLFGTSYGTYVGNLYGGVVPILVYSAAIALSVWHRRSVRSWTGFNLTTAGLTVYVMRYVTLALERVSFYFTSGAIVALPEAIKSEQNAHLRAALQVLAVAGALGLFFYRVATSEWGVYRFFWQ